MTRILGMKDSIVFQEGGWYFLRVASILSLAVDDSDSADSSHSVFWCLPVSTQTAELGVQERKKGVVEVIRRPGP